MAVIFVPFKRFSWLRYIVFMSLIAFSTCFRSSFVWTSRNARYFSTRQRHINSKMTKMSSSAAATVIPRAAISVVVRSSRTVNDTPQFVLVQRGKEPNKGKWSLPGGKIEPGEATLQAAQRELYEETLLQPTNWHKVPITSSDSIHMDESGDVEYHYVISQCFCSLDKPEKLTASDDAADARWFSIDEMKNANNQGTEQVMPTVIQVIERAETMYQAGILDVTHEEYISER